MTIGATRPDRPQREDACAPAAQPETAERRDETTRRFVAAGEILVTRRYGACAMTRAEPRRAFRGVGLWVQTDGPLGEVEGYSLWLVGADGMPSLRLAFATDDNDIVAEWRGRAAALGLPPLMIHADGVVEELRPQVGPLIIGRVTQRPRRAHLDRRRPRFLRRRKTGHPLPGSLTAAR
jgi:hypothetical protein